MKIAEFFGLSAKANGVKPDPRTSQRSARKVITLCQGLLSERGEVSGRRLASDALSAYQSLEEGPQRDAFFELLATEFTPPPELVERAIHAYQKEPSQDRLTELQHAVESPRQELFRRLNMGPEGTRVLVEMRGHMLDGLRRHPEWEPISSDLGHLFVSWFNRGFLVLQRIDWRTSATILEKLIQYEAVHQIHGWPDLRRRLEADRRCFGFFHPALPDEPIIFIEAALTRGMSEKVQPLLDPNAPVFPTEQADCAMFYSITNCQEGLRGVPFGNFLVKQVVEDLGREFPRLRRFATVSPVPGFRDWLAVGTESFRKYPRYDAIAAAVQGIEKAGWTDDPAQSMAIQKELVPLCAWYLLNAKQRKEPLDPVARFHLRNGARLERINWMGDTSAKGLRRSAGVMVNYLYRLGDLERNHERYLHDYEVAASTDVESLVRQFLK